MANEKANWKPSIGVVIFDVVGAILAGLGLAEHFAGTDFVPKALQFENYDIAMIVVGFLMMTPLVVSRIQHARKYELKNE